MTDPAEIQRSLSEQVLAVYSKWDAQNQMIFGCVLVLALFVLLVLLGLWSLTIARAAAEGFVVLIRGHPPDDRLAALRAELDELRKVVAGTPAGQDQKAAAGANGGVS